MKNLRRVQHQNLFMGHLERKKLLELAWRMRRLLKDSFHSKKIFLVHIKLFHRQSTFDRKKAENDFKKHQALLNQIKRVSTSPTKMFSFS